MKVDLAKLRDGLSAREAALKQISAGGAPDRMNRRGDSLLDSCAEVLAGGYPTHSKFVQEALIVDLLDRTRGYQSRFELYQRLRHAFDSTMLRFIATGALEGDPAPLLVGTSAADYSLVVQGMASRDPGTLAGSVLDCLLEHLTAVLRPSRRGEVRTGRQLDGLVRRATGHTGALVSSTLRGSEKAFALANSRLWLALGPSLFCGLGRLIVPQANIELAEIRGLEAQARRAGLGQVVHGLLSLRAACDPGEHSRSWWLAVTKEDGVEIESPGRANSGASDAGEHEYLIHHHSHALRMKRAIEARNVEEVISGVVEAFDVDPELVFQFDWVALQSLLPRRWGAPAMRNVLSAALFDDDRISARSSDIAYTRGSGAFVALLDQLVIGYRLANRHDTILPLIKELRELPGGGSRYLFGRIIQKGVLERLPYTFLANVSDHRARGADDRHVKVPEERRVTINRLKLLAAGADAKLIAPELARETTEQEMRLLWALTWRDVSKNGRIRISELHLRDRVDRLLSGNYALVKFVSDRASSHHEGPTPTIATRILGEQIGLDILFGEGWCLAGSISSNLKHGVIGPRVLRSFADAGAANGNRITLVAEDRESVERLSEEVKSLLTAFMREHLTIVPSGEFYEETVERLAKSIEEACKTGASTASSAEIIAPVAFGQIKLFVDHARTKFVDTTAAEINRRVRALKLSGGDRSLRYAHMLEEEIERALKEVELWLQVAAPGQELDFRLDAVVDYEIQNFLIRAREHMNVAVADRITSGGSHLFSGAYLEVFYQTVHNLVQNAVTYSGRGLETQIGITCYKEGGDVVLECENAFSRSKRRELEARIPQAREIAAGGANNARREKHSGFAKIKAASAEAGLQPPNFEIDSLDARASHYRIVVRWSDAYEKMVVVL